MTPTLPQDELLYAVGDIHGRDDLLADLLERIEADARETPDAARRTLVFLGDYIDRGPDSRGVVERLIFGLPEGFEAHFLKGNHEAILLGFLKDPSRLDHWLVNGGGATMASYGVDIEHLAVLEAPPEIWRNEFAASLPTAHLDFFTGLKLSVSRGDYLFVHAGIRPGLPLAEQVEADLIWIRSPFLDYAGPFGAMVVHGHTPGKEPVTRTNRIGIDTGACFTNRLTALKLKGVERSFLQT